MSLTSHTMLIEVSPSTCPLIRPFLHYLSRRRRFLSDDRVGVGHPSATKRGDTIRAAECRHNVEKSVHFAVNDLSLKIINLFNSS